MNDSAAESRGRVRVERSPRRVRVVHGGQTVADTVEARYVWEVPYYPAYYIPLADVADDVLVESGSTSRSPSRGDATLYTVKTARATAEDAAAQYHDSPIKELRDLVRFEFSAMDAWFEEDEEIHVHPRDPYTRVDILESSRHVVVSVNGEVVADTVRPKLLFETGLPTRYYIPKTDVALDRLSPSSSTTSCPYKGDARYWNVTAGGETVEDLAWEYAAPTRESIPIAGLVCFFNEKVDLTVDGVEQDRPRTKFS